MLKNKVVLLGDSGVGKTNFATRLTSNMFIPNTCTTIGAQFHLHNINYKNETLKLEIWDTAGQERFRSLLPLYIRHAYIIIIVVDASKTCPVEGTFDNEGSSFISGSVYNHVADSVHDSLLFWLTYYEENKNIYSPEHFVIVLFNKIDMLPNKKFVMTDKILNLLNQYELQNNYISISVKDHIGFDEFNKCIIHNIEMKKSYEIIPDKNNAKSSASNTSKTSNTPNISNNIIDVLGLKKIPFNCF